MRRLALAALLAAFAADSAAETVLAARTIRAREVIGASDLELAATTIPGALATMGEAVGREARVTIYAGRPVLAGAIGPAAVVERNDVVALVFEEGGLTITTEGRALDRGAVGERLRVMNLASRSTITGTVAAPGHVTVP